MCITLMQLHIPTLTSAPHGDGDAYKNCIHTIEFNGRTVTFVRLLDVYNLSCYAYKTCVSTCTQFYHITALVMMMTVTVIIEIAKKGHNHNH